MALLDLLGPLGSAYNAYRTSQIPTLKDTGSFVPQAYAGDSYPNLVSTSSNVNPYASNIVGSPGGAYPQPRFSDSPIGPSFPSSAGSPATTPKKQNIPNISGGIDASYSSAFSELDRQLEDLSGQRSGQEQIAENTYQQGLNTLTSQYEQTRGDIEKSQAKTLNELSDAIKQGFQSGNTMLGLRGASDSSAADQYSYALARQASKQRGDIMNEVSGRLTNLQNTYNTNIQNLELEKNNQLQQIAMWFDDAQNQIRSAKSGLQREKSEQALNIALQMFNQIQAEAANQKSILDQWVVNRSTSLQQLAQGLQANAQALPAFQGLDSIVSGGDGGGVNLFGYGTDTEDKNQNLL